MWKTQFPHRCHDQVGMYCMHSVIPQIFSQHLLDEVTNWGTGDGYQAVPHWERSCGSLLLLPKMTTRPATQGRQHLKWICRVKKSKYDRAHWFIRLQENMFFLFITPASFFQFLACVHTQLSPSFRPLRIFTSLFASDTTEAELSSWVILLNLVCLLVYQFNPLFPKGLFWKAIILSPIVSFSA